MGGKVIEREKVIRGSCRDIDDGYCCNEKCELELFNKKYLDDD